MTLPDTVATMLDTWGRYSHDPARAGIDPSHAVSVLATLHPYAQADREAFLHQLRAVALPVGGWVLVGAARVAGELLGRQLDHPVYHEIMLASLRYLHDAGLAAGHLAPYEVDFWLAHRPAPSPAGRAAPGRAVPGSAAPGPVAAPVGSPNGDAGHSFGLGMERSKAGDVDAAAAHFRRASDGGHALAAYALAVLLKDRGQLAEAEAQYRRALGLGLPPEPPEMVADCETSLGYIRSRLGDDHEAERFYRAADARGHLDATFNLGNLLARTGRAAEAEQAFRRAAAAGQADAAYNLAEILADRGDLAGAEALLRQAMAAGIVDAVNNLARVRLQQGDVAEAESLLRRAVDAGDGNAVFNLGIVLHVVGKLDEAETMLRRAAAAGHPEAPARLAQLHAARATAAPRREPSTVDRTPSFGDLGAVFRKDASNADRLKAVRDFAGAARARLQGVAGGSEVLAERSAQLLTEVVARLPIRSADTLARDRGPDAGAQLAVDDAAMLAGWLWTAAAAVPGPPAMVRAVKMILHCAIEIRMIGELYTVLGGPTAARDAGWLGTVLLTWATGRPTMPGATVAAGTVAVAGKVRQAITDLAGNDGRVAAVANRGREGSDTVRRLGGRMHRRMRLHPSTWAPPGTESAVDVAIGVAKDRLGARLPVPLPRGRDGRGQPEPPSGPRVALTRAWALHQQAATVASGLSTSDPMADRLRAALAAQAAHLDGLGRRLGQARPAVPAPARVPAQRGAADAAAASGYAGQAEDAIEAVEEAGARPRRLASWSSRGRSTVVYVVTALLVSAPVAVALWTLPGAAALVLLALQCLVLPWLTVAMSAALIGPLFRPWLGGPVRRHLVVGTLVAFAVHVATGVLATVLSGL